MATFNAVMGVAVLLGVLAGAWFVLGAMGLWLCVGASVALVGWRLWASRKTA
jgi:hypothetical protein